MRGGQCSFTLAHVLAASAIAPGLRASAPPCLRFSTPPSLSKPLTSLTHTAETPSTGKPNRFKDLFSPSRLPPLSLEAASNLAHEAAVTAAGYVRRVAPRSLSDVKGLIFPLSGEAALRAGEGAVLQEGLHKVAVYRDESGAVTRRSAVCPHLGGVVSWNPIDGTFDCPLHGSQFTCRGVLIAGPAVSDLEDLGGSAGPAATAPAGAGESGVQGL